jgi:hypothetical protein
MAPTAFSAEQDVRAFAAEFSTPQVRRALALCESGRLAWDDVAELFRQSLGSALSEA